MPPMVHRPENIKRRGSCTDLRRLHPSSAVRRHRNCQTAQDAETVYTERLQFTFTSGMDFPSDLSPYQVIIHCGGCTLTEKEMQYRLNCAREQGIPITNYGIAIAYMRGILERSMELF